MSTNSELIDELAWIIREVDKENRLTASQLAEAILSHPGCLWQPPDNLAQPEEQGPSEQKIDAFIHQWWEDFGRGYLPNSSDKALVAAALSHWARPASAGGGEVGEVREWLKNHAAHLRKMQEIGALPETELQEMLARAAALLSQQSAPAPSALPANYIDPEHQGEPLALWQVKMAAGCKPGGGFFNDWPAAEIEAVRDWLLPDEHLTPMLPGGYDETRTRWEERQRLRALLTQQAQVAREAGPH